MPSQVHMPTPTSSESRPKKALEAASSHSGHSRKGRVDGEYPAEVAGVPPRSPAVPLARALKIDSNEDNFDPTYDIVPKVL